MLKATVLWRIRAVLRLIAAPLSGIEKVQSRKDNPKADMSNIFCSLYLKEEAYDYLEENTIKDLVKKYSQFINFPIYLWSSKTETTEEPDEEAEAKKTEVPPSEEEEGKVEEASDEKEAKTKKVEKTVWDWVLMNELKPIWTRK